MTTKVKKDELAIEFDGPEVTPDTLDARTALELAAAYIDLLQNIAAEAGHEIRFTGLHIKDKCVAITTETSAPALTRSAATQAGRYISAPETAPSKITDRARRVRRALGRFPEKTSTRIFVGSKWKKTLRVEQVADIGPAVRAVVSLRATLVRVGGETPMVRFESGSEERPFSLEVTRDTAKRLAAYLYGELDIVAHVTRDADGHIDGGTLDEFHAVSEGGAVDSWREWHRENVKQWDEVEDIEGEIGRGRS